MRRMRCDTGRFPRIRGDRPLTESQRAWVAAIIPGAFTVAALLPDAGAGGVGGALRVLVIVPECGIGQAGANQPGVEGIIDDAVVRDGYGASVGGAFADYIGE